MKSIKVLAVAGALCLATSAYAQTGSRTTSGTMSGGTVMTAPPAGTMMAPDPADPSSTGSITTGTASPVLESSGNVRNPERLSNQQTEGGGNESTANGQ
jgi:hypothetical protein